MVVSTWICEVPERVVSHHPSIDGHDQFPRIPLHVSFLCSQSAIIGLRLNKVTEKQTNLYTAAKVPS